MPITYNADWRKKIDAALSLDECQFEWPKFFDTVRKWLPKMSDKEFSNLLAAYWQDPAAKWHW